ncbi:MAG: elongation factor 1-beta [Candidatus Altiarchaeales archaeon HGW-Altiarchaeales-3]|nr:MAG: elongation factor 1-beta [Candidatus Altiarchaeales archaeon HGW-Altiarchaeales-3]
MELNLAVELRIMPESPEVDLNKIKEELSKIVKEYGKLHSAEEMPIAFGLKSLDVTVLLNDKRGGCDEIQEAGSKIEGVSEIDVVNMTLI